MHALFLQNTRFILCYHKDWFHMCSSNMALAHPHSSLYVPNALFQQFCLFCIIPGILLPLHVFTTFPCCSLSHVLPVYCLLACSFTALEIASCIHQLVLMPNCPVRSFPPCAVMVVQLSCLAEHIKSCIISHPSFLQVLFLISLPNLHALGCKHVEEEGCFMLNSIKPCANCW